MPRPLDLFLNGPPKLPNYEPNNGFRKLARNPLRSFPTSVTQEIRKVNDKTVSPKIRKPITGIASLFKENPEMTDFAMSWPGVPDLLVHINNDLSKKNGKDLVEKLEILESLIEEVRTAIQLGTVLKFSERNVLLVRSNYNCDSPDISIYPIENGDANYINQAISAISISSHAEFQNVVSRTRLINIHTEDPDELTPGPGFTNIRSDLIDNYSEGDGRLTITSSVLVLANGRTEVSQYFPFGDELSTDKNYTLKIENYSPCNPDALLLNIYSFLVICYFQLKLISKPEAISSQELIETKNEFDFIQYFDATKERLNVLNKKETRDKLTPEGKKLLEGLNVAYRELTTWWNQFLDYNTGKISIINN